MQRVGANHTVVDANGNGVNAATVTVYDSVTLLALANVYEATGSLTAPASKVNPFTTDSVGRWAISLPDGRYNFAYTGGNFANYTDYNICVFDNTITYPSPALGTVTSVAQTVPAEFTITGSPVTSTGTLAIAKATQAKNTIWAGPTTGANAQPTFRVAVLADLPAFGPTASTTFGSATKASVVTTNAQGIITTITESTVTPAWASVSSTPTTVAGYGITNSITILATGPSTNTTVGNTTTETSLLQNPYASMNPTAGGGGTTLRTVIMGFYAQSVAAQTLRIRMKAGTQVLLDTTALTFATLSTTTSSPFRLELVFTGRVSDPTVGTGWGQIFLTTPGAGLATTGNTYCWPEPGFTADATGLNTASPGAIDVLLQWGTAGAGATITVTNFTVYQEGVH